MTNKEEIKCLVESLLEDVNDWKVDVVFDKWYKLTHIPSQIIVIEKHSIWCIITYNVNIAVDKNKCMQIVKMAQAKQKQEAAKLVEKNVNALLQVLRNKPVQRIIGETLED